MKAINKQRCRTIQKLLSKGIRHRLFLRHQELTLNDRPELVVWNATTEQEAFVKEWFANVRTYTIKVSGLGSGVAAISQRHIVFKQLTHKQLMLDFGEN